MLTQELNPQKPAVTLSWSLPGRRPVTLRRIVWACILGLVFVAGLAVLVRYDLSIMRSIGRVRGAPRQPSFWSQDSMFRGFRAFAEFVVIGSVIAAISALDRRRRLVLSHVILAIILAGAFQLVAKMTVGCTRPNMYVGDTWSGMWLGVDFALRDADDASFPSGHTTLAFAFALTLAWFYPSLRWLFFVLATGCAASRVAHGVHWPADCWGGAWLGYLTSWVALRPHVFRATADRTGQPIEAAP